MRKILKSSTILILKMSLIIVLMVTGSCATMSLVTLQDRTIYTSTGRKLTLEHLILDKPTESFITSGRLARQIEDLTELKKFITEDWKVDVKSIQEEFSKLENVTSSEDFMSMYLASIGNLRSALTIAINYPQKIATNITRIEILSEVLKQTVTSNNKAAIDAFLEKVLPETKGKLKGLKDGLLTKYADLAGEVLKLVVGKQQIELTNGLDASGDLPPGGHHSLPP